MIPGEIFPADGELILNADREAITLIVANLLGIRARQSLLDDDLLCALVVSQLRAARMTFMMNDP